MIPDSDKRQKLSFSIGLSKPNRPSASSSSYCQPSSASSSSSSSSLSSSQSTSDVQPDVRFIPRPLNQVSGMPFSNGDHNPVGNGASFLVPYSQESSEESDQENCGTLDNGSSSKSHPNENKDTGNVFDNSPKTTNGESGVHHNGNGLNGQTYGDFKSSQNGHHNGHHKVNGHGGPDKVNLVFIFIMLVCLGFCLFFLKGHIINNSFIYFGHIRSLAVIMAVRRVRLLLLME